MPLLLKPKRRNQSEEAEVVIFSTYELVTSDAKNNLATRCIKLIQLHQDIQLRQSGLGSWILAFQTGRVQKGQLMYFHTINQRTYSNVPHTDLIITCTCDDVRLYYQY